MLINFPYIQRDSPVHRLDARAKLLLLFAFSFAVAQTSNFWIILAALVGAMLYYRQTYLKWSETRRTWYFVIALNIMIVLSNFFVSGGVIIRGTDVVAPHVFYQLPFIGFTSSSPFIGITTLPISIENLTFLATQAMRNFGIAFLAISLPYTTNPSHIARAIKGLGVPDNISYAVDLTFRFLPTVGRDFSTTMDAQRARGFEIDKLRGGVFGKIARLAPLIVPLVIGSIVGAEDIINAMELRCFGSGKRSWLAELRFRRVDQLVVILTLIAFFAITILNILGNYYVSGPLHILHIQGIPYALFTH